jgi:K+-sensing histidine kinase KdpD
MIPLDAELFDKALSMIFREILPSVPQGSTFGISIKDCANEVEIVIGEMGEGRQLCEPFDHEMQRKPWSLGLFLNIAHKIIVDHGGKILLDPEGHSPYPVIIRMPRTIKV